MSSCSAFDVATRKVPSLALVPRGHLNHATRATKKVAGSVQHATKRQHRENEAADRFIGDKSPPPPLPRRQQLGDTLEETAAGEKRQEPSPGRHQVERGIQEEEEEEEDTNDDAQSELRLGERFLNVMALMARLATQSLGETPAPTSPGSPSRLARTSTERSLSPLARSNTKRTPTEPALSPVATASSPRPPKQLQTRAASPPTSPKHAVRKVAERLPRALHGPLTFDISMLLPAPLDERQSPLKSPIRRKRLRKRVRRRKLRRQPRRTWHASHASWPAHASADYIVDHSHQDTAGISAARLVERLSERKVNVQTLPRVLSLPLPPLHRSSEHVVLATNSTEAEEHYEEDADVSEEHESDDQDDMEREGEQMVDSDDGAGVLQDESDEASLHSDNTAASATSSPRDDVADKTAALASKRPLYHQPAWISPELHAWLVASGLFATKPRRELLSTTLTSAASCHAGVATHPST
ncbi:hypothetical protein PHYPSEUDO_012504 [Phytophthora pseudosyringae]|uniref:Uncharacterized protein n=1 Tax=Phytophthora pseudosyringae TaxID=221518 RepID=A0A8T1W8H5_9STRA|nr:hypothetical protein PHYPSEUDO_012504 [Phytophthora pseudosyringae]